MTQYTHRITLIVPEQHMEIANHLALIMGESTADIGTFVTADWRDADGNLYSVCSAASKPVVLGALTKGLPNPLPAHATAADVTKAQHSISRDCKRYMNKPEIKKYLFFTIIHIKVCVYEIR